MKNLIYRIKKKATVSNVVYTIIMAVLLVTLISPDAKSLMIKGMMKIGLFDPDVPDTAQMAGETGPIAAPEAVFKNGAGEEARISELKGKVVFINFWATWCPPCRAEMPTINKLYAQFKDNDQIVFLIVDADHDYAKSNEYLQDNDLDLPLYVAAGNIPYVYFSGALPTTVMVDKKGKLVFRHAGAADYSDPKMVNFIQKLIENP